MTKMILYKSCFGETQQKIKFEINLKKLLTNPALHDKIHHVPNGTYALVAQLDRVTDYESVGRGFESLPSHQVKSHD